MQTESPGTERPKGAIWKQDSVLEDTISRVTEKVAALENQLSPLLRDQPPQTESPAKEVQADPDFVQRLRTRIDGVKQIEIRLGSLIERLEI